MSNRWKSLPIPTNQNYDWNGSPDQANFFNPVTLCNKEVQYANDIIDITGDLMAFNKEIGKIKLRLKQLEKKRDDMEALVLVDQPPRQAESKNIKLLGAYILSVILGSGNAEEYQALREEQAILEEDLITVSMKKNSAEAALDALKLVSQNMQTALSFYKAELSVFRK